MSIIKSNDANVKVCTENLVENSYNTMSSIKLDDAFVTKRSHNSNDLVTINNSDTKMSSIKLDDAFVTKRSHNSQEIAPILDSVDGVIFENFYKAVATKKGPEIQVSVEEFDALDESNLDGFTTIVRKKDRQKFVPVQSSILEEHIEEDPLPQFFNRKARNAYKKELEKAKQQELIDSVYICGVQLDYKRYTTVTPAVQYVTSSKYITIGGGTQMWRTNRVWANDHKVIINGKVADPKNRRNKNVGQHPVPVYSTPVEPKNWLPPERLKKKARVAELREKRRLLQEERFEKANFLKIEHDDTPVVEEEYMEISNPGKLAYIQMEKWIMRYIQADPYLEQLYSSTEHRSDNLYRRIYDCIQNKTYKFSLNFSYFDDDDEDLSSDEEEVVYDFSKLPFSTFIDQPVYIRDNDYALDVVHTLLKQTGSSEQFMDFIWHFPDAHFIHTLYEQDLEMVRKQNPVRTDGVTTFCFLCCVEVPAGSTGHELSKKHVLRTLMHKDITKYHCYICLNNFVHINDFAKHMDSNTHVTTYERLMAQVLRYKAQMMMCPEYEIEDCTDTTSEFVQDSWCVVCAANICKCGCGKTHCACDITSGCIHDVCGSHYAVCSCGVYNCACHQCVPEAQGATISTVYKIPAVVTKMDNAIDSASSFMDSIKRKFSMTALDVASDGFILIYDTIVDILILKEGTVSTPLAIAKIVGIVANWTRFVGCKVAAPLLHAQDNHGAHFLDYINKAGHFASAINAYTRLTMTAKDLANWFFEHMPSSLLRWYEYYFGKNIETLVLEYGERVKRAESSGLYHLYDTEIEELRDALIKKFVYNKKPSVITSFRIYDTVRSVLRMRTTPDERREIPFLIHMVGKPQIGKSTVCAYLADIVQQLDNRKGNDKNGTYTRSPASEYWDGVKSDVHTIVMDDFMANRDLNDIAEVLMLKTIAAFRPNVASVDDENVGIKGMTIAPRLILCPSNIDNYSLAESRLHDAGAIVERIDMKVMVEELPDTKKKPGSFDHLVFEVVEASLLCSGKGIKLRFREFISYMLEQYYTHFANQKKVAKATPTPLLLDELEIEFKKYHAQGLGTELFASGSLLAVASSLGLTYSSGAILDKGFTIHGMKFDVAFWLRALTFAGTLLAGAGIVYGVKQSIDEQYKRNRDVDVAMLTGICEVMHGRKTTNAMALEYVLNREQMNARKFLLKLAHKTDFCSLNVPFPDIMRVDESITVHEYLQQITIQQVEAHNMRFDAESFSVKDKRRARVRNAEEKSSEVSEIAANLIPSVAKNVRTNIVPSLFGSEQGLTPSAQACTDLQAADITRTALNSTIFLSLWKGKERQTALNAIHLRDNWYLVPRHFFAMITDDDEYMIEVFTMKVVPSTVPFATTTTIEVTKNIQYDPRYRKDVEGIDLSIYQFNTLPLKRPLLNYFIREDELPFLKQEMRGNITGFTVHNNRLIASDTHSTQMQRVEKLHYTVRDHIRDYTYIPTGYTYGANTRDGDCGSLVIAYDTDLPHKVVGVHMFGMTGDSVNGGCVCVTYEQVMQVIEAKERPYIFPDEILPLDPLGLKYQAGCQSLNIQCVGKLKKGAYINRTTDFYPTGLEQLFPNTKKPSEKGFKDDPLLYGIFEYGSPCLEYKIEESILDKALSEMPKDVAKIYTPTEALNAQGCMNPINLATSMGYPYTIEGVTKKDVIGFDGQYYFKEGYAEKMDTYIESFYNEDKHIIWICSLKDELIKQNKRARVFEIPPFEHTLMTRMYFGSWISMMHKNHGRNFSQVGMNPESMDWEYLYNDLVSLSPYGVDADVVRYDKDLAASLFMYATLVVNRWYKDNDKNWKEKDDEMRNRITYATIVCFLLYGDYVFQVFKGMKSGWVLTLLFNTLCHYLLILKIYVNLVPVQYTNLKNLRNHIRIALFGDDVLLSVAVFLLPFFNRKTLSEAYMKYFNMCITDSSKSKSMSLYNDILSLSFLKHNFNIRNGKVVGELEWLSLVSMLCYLSKNKYNTSEQQFLFNIDTFSRFCFYRGELNYSTMSQIFPMIDYTFLHRVYLSNMDIMLV